MRFYLWGPSSTGKTWLFDSFIRKVNLIDEALSKQKPEILFSLWIDDQLGMRQHRYTLDNQLVPATIDIDYQEYTFYKEYLPNNEKFKLACSHSHKFMMLDGPGDETTGQLLVDSNTEENRAKVLSANEALKDADYLIICVERGQRNLDAVESQNVGQHYVQRLRDLLSLNRRQGQEIVICFTKADRYGGKVAGFDAALSRLFGMYGQEVGHLLRELNGNRLEPPHFFVSAVGYYRNPQNGKVSPNYNSSENKLIEPESWNPDEVEKPFFKILTEAERRTILEMKVNNSNLITRLASNAMNDSLRKDLLNDYIDYDVMLKNINIRAR
jgi:hypothetical protein